MGRIFTWGEIVDKKIPSVESFVDAKSSALSMMSGMIETGVLRGARITGSVAEGMQTIRSDIDCLVAPVDGRESLARDQMRELSREITDAYHIDFAYSPYFFDGREMLSEITTILKGRYPLVGNLIGEDPLEILPRKKADPRAIVVDELCAGLMGFSESAFYPDDARERNIPLQFALESAGQIARAVQVLRASNEGVSYRKDDALSSLVCAFGEIGISVEYLKRLMDTDAAYNLLLTEAISGRVEQTEYESFLRRETDRSQDAAFRVHSATLRGLDALINLPLIGEGQRLTPFERR
ncbi:MAG: hypothetical protein RLZZ455_948 [Candidatus Parcubacteria bacterium]|jgi:predicted nucleotidyltransferase